MCGYDMCDATVPLILSSPLLVSSLFLCLAAQSKICSGADAAVAPLAFSMASDLGQTAFFFLFSTLVSQLTFSIMQIYNLCVGGWSYHMVAGIIAFSMHLDWWIGSGGPVENKSNEYSFLPSKPLNKCSFQGTQVPAPRKKCPVLRQKKISKKGFVRYRWVLKY